MDAADHAAAHAGGDQAHPAARSLNQPLIVIFEDLHWIDNETQALPEPAGRLIANARILLLVNYRPEYRASMEQQDLLHPAAARSAGQGERRRDADRAARRRAPSCDPLKRLIIERTEGNPFFMEEMVQVLFDEGALVRNGAVEADRAA